MKTPTPSESIVLQLLWDKGSATVPELHKKICETANVGYTTVLKRVQRMEEKQLIQRLPNSGRAHCYEAIFQPEKTRKSLVDRLIETAFDASPKALIQHAIGQNSLSPKDIEQIRNLLDQVEKRKDKQ